jgi:tol-pal system protein YbgF
MARTVPRSASIVISLSAVLALSAPAAAQNREHQQLYAEFAMLHEQMQQLRLAVNTLAEQIQSTDARLAEQTETARTNIADQRLLIDNLSSTLAKFGERLNDNSVRVGQLSAEMDAIRDGLGTVQSLLNQILSWLQPPAPETPAGEVPAGQTPPSQAAGGAPAGGGQPATPPAPAPPTVGTLASSPAAYYQQGFGAYISTDYETAIAAFQDFIAKFPNAEDAPNAYFFMGESLYHLGRYKEALQAYGSVISRYKTSERVPEAYFKQGVCYEQLRQREEARKIYELIQRQYPNTSAAAQAERRLDALNLIRNES